MAIRDLFAGYSREPRPLKAYAALTGVYNAAFAAFLLRSKQAGRPLPERVSPGDILLLGVATHKLNRLLAKDWVTSFYRAPFVAYQGAATAPAEVSEEPRGEGLQRALGELVT